MVSISASIFRPQPELIEPAKFRRYYQPGSVFYFSSGKTRGHDTHDIHIEDLIRVSEKRRKEREAGQDVFEQFPVMFIERMAVDYILRKLECHYAYRGFRTSLRLPALADYHTAASQDPDLNSILSLEHQLEPTDHAQDPKRREWLRHLILPGDANTTTEKYVLVNQNGEPLSKSRHPRIINPVDVRIGGDFESNKYWVSDLVYKIKAEEVHDIPFRLGNSRYNSDDVDAQTGFLSRVNSSGKYSIEVAHPELLNGDRLHVLALDTAGGGVKVLEMDSPNKPGFCVTSLDKSPFRIYSNSPLPPRLHDRETDILNTLERLVKLVSK